MSIVSGLRKFFAGLLCCLVFSHTAFADENQFKDYEIRVIRNKSFSKRYRLELDLGLGGVMNQSFQSSFVATGGLGFHLSETFGLHLEGTYVHNRDKAECSDLGSASFNIQPILVKLNNFYGGYLSVTPAYGKYQLSGGDVLYFDWFFTAGGGLSGNTVSEDGCTSAEAATKTANITGVGPQFNAGVGQRYFLGSSTAFLWQLRYLVFKPASPDLEMNVGGGLVILSLGIGYFL